MNFTREKQYLLFSVGTTLGREGDSITTYVDRRTNSPKARQPRLYREAIRSLRLSYIRVIIESRPDYNPVSTRSRFEYNLYYEGFI